MAALTLLGITAPATATDRLLESLPATDIYAACMDKEEVVSNEICYAFVLGVVQSHWSAATGDAELLFCLPDPVTRKRVIGALRKHFRRAAKEGDLPADQFVTNALAAAFPCTAAHD
ncbi:MAG: Rap1a/Tai family immunity protein [Pseudomonadota bacterium]